MTVGVYARHSSKCPKSKEKNPGQWKRCECPLWLQWNRAKEQFKKSAKTRSWEHKQVQPLTQAKWVSSWLRPLRVCWIPISLTRSKRPSSCFSDGRIGSIPKAFRIADACTPIGMFLTMQRDPASQHENENERTDCRYDDPDIVSAYAFRSSLGNGLSWNVVAQPQKPAVCACRSRQSGLPNQLNPNRVQESSRRQQEGRREVRNQRKPSQPSLFGSRNAHVPHEPSPHNQYGNIVRRHSNDHEQRPPQPVRG